MKWSTLEQFILYSLLTVFTVFLYKTLVLIFEALLGPQSVRLLSFFFGWQASSILILAIHHSHNVVQEASLCFGQINNIPFRIHQKDLKLLHARIKELRSQGFTPEEIEQILSTAFRLAYFAHAKSSPAPHLTV